MFAIIQAATGKFLPHDGVYLAMSASQLCALDRCRILHFMIHDRMSFGGVLIAIGVVYLWLVRFPLREAKSWAWWTLALSAVAGFLSFLAYLGYGYLDTWHGLATLVLLPVFATGLLRAHRYLRTERETATLDIRSSAGLGRVFLLLASVGIAAGGLTIMIVGMTSVFVPQDLEFMGMTHESLGAVNRHLIPLIAHDRAGFGGALVSFAVAMFGCVWCARPSRSLLRTLTIAGLAGFGTAVGIHPVIGYTNVIHLAPAVVGCLVFALGLVLAQLALRR